MFWPPFLTRTGQCESETAELRVFFFRASRHPYFTSICWQYVAAPRWKPTMPFPFSKQIVDPRWSNRAPVFSLSLMGRLSWTWVPPISMWYMHGIHLCPFVWENSFNRAARGQKRHGKNVRKHVFCDPYDFRKRRYANHRHHSHGDIHCCPWAGLAQMRKQRWCTVLSRPAMTQCYLCIGGFSITAKVCQVGAASNSGYVDKRGCYRFDFTRVCACGKGIQEQHDLYPRQIWDETDQTPKYFR